MERNDCLKSLVRFSYLPVLFLCVGLGIQLVQAAEPEVAESFKVGTFEVEGEPFVGIVLRDRWIVDLNEANAALEKQAIYPQVPAPADMIELIERYDYGLKRRLYEIVNELVEKEDFREKIREAILRAIPYTLLNLTDYSVRQIAQDEANQAVNNVINRQ